MRGTCATGYNLGMSTPGTVEPYSGQGSTVNPSAVASASDSAVWTLGEVLKNMFTRTPAAFHSESELDKAILAVDNFVKANTSRSAVRALATGEETAPKEDVTQRVPPGGASPVNVAGPSGPIDYEKLAAAIVRMQRDQGAVEGKVVPNPEGN